MLAIPITTAKKWKKIINYTQQHSDHTLTPKHTKNYK